MSNKESGPLDLNSQPFAGRVAVVTGAGSGLGRATAHLLSARGARVACLDLSVEGLAETAKDLRDAITVECDVTSSASVNSAMEQVVRSLGAPQVLVNSAGIGGFEKSVEASDDHWNRIIAVNLTGSFFMCRAALAHMVPAADGVIVNIASNAGLVGQPYSAAYCASKGGVVMLTKSLALEFMGKGIRVVCVAPGGMKTAMPRTFRLPEGEETDWVGRYISKLGMADPMQVARGIAYIASDEADYVTGTVLSVDGGLTAH